MFDISVHLQKSERKGVFQIKLALDTALSCSADHSMGCQE